ncbi:dynein regulatory complex protein 10 [Cephus cinctus]|uniref:Dynein regulatory complex protein 10 n=1 Tax=Cephus cinctus TaxID=211228 RepID=A0AAJ7RI32_CEPCN|nr:dynein regulatory complex protein 10 [Cephus cinctus]
MDCEVAVQRMQTIISRTFGKLKLAVCLSAILKYKNLPRILTPAEMSTVQKTCEFYSSFSEDADNSNFEDFNSFTYNPQLTIVIEILHNYPEVHELAEKLLKDVPASSKSLIYSLELFSNIMEKRMRTTPTEHRQHELKLRNAFKSAKKSEEDIVALQEMLEEQQSRHNEIIRELNDSIARDESLMAKIKKRLDDERTNKVNESESQMVKSFSEMRAMQESLQSEINNCTERLKVIMQDNAQREKELRARRTKVESQFVALLGKYDTEIGARHQLMESLMAESEALRKEQEDIQSELNTQSVLYTKWKEEKELATMEAFKERLNDFVRNRAAKVIQKAWQTHNQRNVTRKKKKSKKK